MTRAAHMTTKQNGSKMTTPGSEKELINEISLLIEQSKQHVVLQANSTLTLLFWNVGKRINAYVLKHQRAKYGKQIVVTLSRHLVHQYGRNFEEKNLRRMLQFADLFPDVEKVVTLSRHLSWSHFLVLLPLKESPRCLFYAHKAINENLGVRALRKQITQKTYERTAIANTQLPEMSHQLSDSFKDPYLLDFLKLPVSYLEDDLEAAILKELESFILEIGKGFATELPAKKELEARVNNAYQDAKKVMYNRKLIE